MTSAERHFFEPQQTETKINNSEVGTMCKARAERLCAGLEALHGDYNAKRAERYRRLTALLEELGVPFHIQETENVKNIIISFTNPKLELADRVLVSAHYDVETNTPGANDNTSAVAVCLALAEQLQRTGPSSLRKNIEIVFFDLEERDQQGSELYCKESVNDLPHTVAVLNMEAVGIGDTPVLWPIHESNEKLISGMRAIMPDLELVEQHPDVIVDFASDHNAFIANGIPSVSLVMMPREDMERARTILSANDGDDTPVSVKFSASIPMFAGYHQVTDTPDKLQPATLNKAHKIILTTLKELEAI